MRRSTHIIEVVNSTTQIPDYESTSATFEQTETSYCKHMLWRLRYGPLVQGDWFDGSRTSQHCVGGSTQWWLASARLYSTWLGSATGGAALASLSPNPVLSCSETTENTRRGQGYPGFWTKSDLDPFVTWKTADIWLENPMTKASMLEAQSHLISHSKN